MIINGRIQALHKSGPRAFSGPVEKVLKWHKALQDIGVFVFYEIVGELIDHYVIFFYSFDKLYALLEM